MTDQQIEEAEKNWSGDYIPWDMPSHKECFIAGAKWAREEAAKEVEKAIDTYFLKTYDESKILKSLAKQIRGE